MSSNIVLIHSAIGLLLLLYLFVRIVFSLFGLNDSDYQAIMRRKFKVSDYIFLVLILVTGLYPLVVLGRVELYHILKLGLLALIFWSSRISKMNFVGASFLGIAVLIISSYFSFTDSPTFPKEKGMFEQDYPEVATMTQIEKGQIIFNTVCAKCHGVDGRKGMFGAADLSKSKMKLEARIDGITNGSPMTVMQGFENQLSTEEIESVAVYIETLRN